ncbi:hypothetical protein ACLJYM_24830 [Rhizobium giardinii]|uniref:hypothetical protein n=1 Tax=Rhizobium giardinii TaxID=56731 RepID=UPI0039E033DF
MKLKMTDTLLTFVAAAVALAGVMVMLCLGGSPAFAEANDVTFPPVGDLVHYTTVERGVTTEHMLTSQTALDALKAGTSVPVGTHVVLVDYQSGKLFRYLVSQKMGEGIDDWQYQWFWPDRKVKTDENAAQCYSCHRSRQDQSFMFTHSDALGFDGT